MNRILFLVAAFASFSMVLGLLGLAAQGVLGERAGRWSEPVSSALVSAGPAPAPPQPPKRLLARAARMSRSRPGTLP